MVSFFSYGKLVADVERSIIEALEKQFSEVLSPLKESKVSPLKYVQRLTKTGQSNLYGVPKEVCLLCFLTFQVSLRTRVREL